MTPRDLYRKYLNEMVANRLTRTLQHNEDLRPHFTNHRAVSGISPDNKWQCYTPVAKFFEGPYMTDVDDNRYTDITMGFGVSIFGHSPDFIRDSVESANRQSWGLGPLTPLALQVAEGLKQLTGVERVSFYNTGSEAVGVAIRIARAYSGRNKIVVFSGSYHGHQDATLVFKTDPMSGLAVSVIPGIPPSAQADTILLDFDSDHSLQYIADHAGSIAAVITEPVQSRNPGCQPRAFLQKLREITREKDIALIFDEIITGFRIHPGGAQAYFQIEADIVTYGKIIGGGLPLGIVAGKSRYLDLVDGGAWKYGDASLPNKKKTFVAGTFCAHPIVLHTSLAVIKRLLAEGETLLSRLNDTTKDFAESLNLWMREQAIPVSVSYFGSLFRINTPAASRILFHHLLLEGIYIWEGRTSFLSTAHSPGDIAFISGTIKKCVLMMKACGYFPSPNTEKTTEPANETAFTVPPPAAFSSSLNLGVSVCAKQPMDPALLLLSTRFVLGKLPQIKHIHPDQCIRHSRLQEAGPIESIESGMINNPDIPHGIQICLVYRNERIVTLILTASKSVLDGWSLSVILQEILACYYSLSQGDRLPPYLDFSNTRGIQPVSVPVYRGAAIYPAEKKTWEISAGFPEIRKKARQMNMTPLGYCQHLFAAAIAKQSVPGEEVIRVGTPVAGQVIHGCYHAIGPFSTIKTSVYAPGVGISSLIVLPGEDPPAADYIINIDRIPGGGYIQELDADIRILDPAFMRYKIVLNILACGSRNLVIDIKWSKDHYDLTGISSIIRSFMGQLTDSYEIA